MSDLMDSTPDYTWLLSEIGETSHFGEPWTDRVTEVNGVYPPLATVLGSIFSSSPFESGTDGQLLISPASMTLSTDQAVTTETFSMQQIARFNEEPESSPQHDKRIRTRKKNPNRGYGPNPWGRAGCRRCKQCRLWRRKCKYNEDNLDEPCQLCRERGFPCTAEHKLLAPSQQRTISTNLTFPPKSLQSTFAISRQPPMPDDLILIDIETDSLYREFYQLKYGRPGVDEDGWITLRVLNNMVNVLKEVTFFECSLGSPLVMSAQLAFASYAKQGHRTTTNQYLAVFYRLAHEALIIRDLLNLAHASYLVALLSLFSGDSPPSIQVHSLQFVRVVDALCKDSGGITQEYLAAVECMWNLLIGSLILLRGRRGTGLNFEEENQFLLQQSSSLVSRDVTKLGLSRSTEKILSVKLITLATVFSTQFLDFACECKINRGLAPTERSIAIFTSRAMSATEQIFHLSSIMHGATDLIRDATSFGRSMQLGDGFDYEELDTCEIIPEGNGLPSYKWRMAFVYCFLSFVRAMINPTANFNDISTSDASAWAFSLCYLCKMRLVIGGEPLTLFALFWVAIVLAKRFPSANMWVRQRIDDGIEKWGAEWIKFEDAQVFETLKLLDKVEGCCSLYEIIGRVSSKKLRFVFNYITSPDMARELHEPGDGY